MGPGSPGSAESLPDAIIDAWHRHRYVRAVAGDGLAMAWIQLEVWQTAFGALLPPEVLATPPADLAESWTAALNAASQIVLVATEGAEIVGFAHAARDP